MQMSLYTFTVRNLNSTTESNWSLGELIQIFQREFEAGERTNSLEALNENKGRNDIRSTSASLFAGPSHQSHTYLLQKESY